MAFRWIDFDRRRHQYNYIRFCSVGIFFISVLFFFAPQPGMWMFFQPRHLGAHNAFAVVVFVVVGYRTFWKEPNECPRDFGNGTRKSDTFFPFGITVSLTNESTQQKTIAEKNENFVCAFAIAASVRARDNWWIGDRLKWNGMVSLIHSFDFMPDWGRDDIQFMHTFICAD